MSLERIFYSAHLIMSSLCLKFLMTCHHLYKTSKLLRHKIWELPRAPGFLICNLPRQAPLTSSWCILFISGQPLLLASQSISSKVIVTKPSLPAPYKIKLAIPSFGQPPTMHYFATFPHSTSIICCTQRLKARSIKLSYLVLNPGYATFQLWNLYGFITYLCLPFLISKVKILIVMISQGFCGN